MKYVFILSLLCFGCSKTPEASAPIKLRLKSPDLEQPLWQRYRRSQTSDRLLSQKGAQDIAAEFGRLRFLSTRTDVEPYQIERARRELEKSAWSYLNGTTPSTYMKLGRIMARRFINSISNRIKQSASLTADTDSQNHKEYLSQVGTFTRDAIRDGWVPTTMTPLTECMFTAIYMHDWMRPVEGRIAIQDYLDPLERYCELRWRVERAVSVSLKARLEAIEELKAVHSYPVDYNRIALLLNAGQINRVSTLLIQYKGADKALLTRHLKQYGQPQ
ncbi:MAG: hypothetical protein VYA30_13565 [Myxococcota bacterium]|nr:hypothetical protein [Myxococcota bacterium]